MRQDMTSGARWALVTFALGITANVIGRYVPNDIGTWASVAISFLFAFIGWMVHDIEDTK